MVAQSLGSLLLLDLLFTSSDHHHPHMVLCNEDLDPELVIKFPIISWRSSSNASTMLRLPQALSVSPPATSPPPIDQGTHHPNTDHSHLLHTKGELNDGFVVFLIFDIFGVLFPPQIYDQASWPWPPASPDE